MTGAAPDPEDDAGDTEVGPLLECDLVMKGGITSGVVYPSAVLQLREKYRFVNIGGASAGAIAAVATAAAEFRRQTESDADRADAGFDELRVLVDELTRPGFLQGLFQPIESAREAFEFVLTGLRTKGRPIQSKAIAFGKVVLRHHRGGVAVGAAVSVGVALAVLAIAGASSVIAPLGSWGPVGWLTVLLLLVVITAIGAVVGASTAFVRSGRRLVAILANSGFGICPGLRQPGSESDGLTDWLHATIQRCAGLPLDRPLTFGDLKAVGIHLETMTTDLSYGRPVRLPFEFGGYRFRPDEMRVVFPEPIVSWLEAHPGMPFSHCGEPEPVEELRWIPETEHLPVLLAARLSLSFPALISAVPLYTHDCANPSAPIVQIWFSDGGISSNFPIHFFDGWLPGRPTFGLDLGPYPMDALGHQLATAEADGGSRDWATADVFMPRTRLEGRFPRWVHIGSVFGFYGRILTTMQNWRDNLQSEIPGFRDRVCQIRLRTETEGGMNLDMDPETIRSLIRKGSLAGTRLRDDFNFAQHQFTRYLMLMQTLQVRLAGEAGRPGVRQRYDAFGPILAAGAPDATEYREAHEPAWCVTADRVTRELLEAVAAWRDAGEERDRDGIEFVIAEEKQPTWVMRITPKV